MLVLTRKSGQRILINQGEIVLTILGFRHGQVRVGLDAPNDVNIVREELEFRTRPKITFKKSINTRKRT